MISPGMAALEIIAAAITIAVVIFCLYLYLRD